MSSTIEEPHSAPPPESQSSQQQLPNGKKPLNILVIGGSCSGLIAGILLKRQGHNVHIFESAGSDEREGQAAGIGLSLHVKRFFDENDRLSSIPFGVPNEKMEITNQNLKTVMHLPISQRMTTWEATYYRLRANFDGYKSAHCPNPPELSSDLGTGVFDTGRRVLRVDDGGSTTGPLKITIQNVDTRDESTHEADIVIAADGANSSTRRQLMPNIQRHEPGYVLWRGTIPTSRLSQEVLVRIEGKTFLYRMRYSYIIIYTIPGHHGNLTPGSREINFAWYEWKTPSEIRSILTDTNNHTHRTTLPKGLMNPSIWETQLAHARKQFHPYILALIENIDEPFVSVISSHSSPRAAFFNDRLFLIGDALAQKQPNTGQGISWAAKNAMDLAEMVAERVDGSAESAGVIRTDFKSSEGELRVRKWEDRVLEDAERECVRSVAFAAWFLNGWVGWAWHAVSYVCVLFRQRVTRWVTGRVYPGLTARR